MANKKRYKKKSESWLLGINAYCETCDFEQYANNAVGLAAQHTEATGHTTLCEVTRAVQFEVDSRVR